MPPQKRILRSLPDIRTHSGKVDLTASPYMAYMKVSCLEMEKFRRGKEKTSALRRVDHINIRFKEIEAEKAGILKTLKEEKHVSGLSSSSEPPPSFPLSAGGFKLRY
jgi:hypothetical protein